jgi:hypothetical protein
MPSVLLPTNDPARTEQEWQAKGYHTEQLYVARMNPKLIENLLDRSIWILAMSKPDEPEQRELL